MFFFFKQKTAYEMRISDWSSDVCSSDLAETGHGLRDERRKLLLVLPHGKFAIAHLPSDPHRDPDKRERRHRREQRKAELHIISADANTQHRSEERRVGKECVST